MVFTFKLRKGKKSVTIIAEFRYGSNIRIRQSTKFNIPINSAKYWDSKIQLIKSPNDILDSNLINIELNKIRTSIYSELSTGIENQSIDEIRNKVQNIINPKPIIKEVENSKDKSLVLNYFKHYIEFYRTNISPTTGRVLSSQTLKTYSNTLVFLKRYLDTKQIREFRFNGIDKTFYYDFISYGQKLGYSKNYIGSHLQKLKTIVQAAYDDDIHNNSEFRKRYFKKFREEVNHPYLTEDEVSKLIKLNIKCQRLDNIRDIFLIACNTGLRIGDLMKFLKNPQTEFIEGKKHIYVKQSKTNKLGYKQYPKKEKWEIPLLYS